MKRSNPGAQRSTIVPPGHASRPGLVGRLVACAALVLGLGMTPAAAQVACLPPPAGLVGWWSGDGHALDLMGKDNGVLLNGATFGPGRVDQAFRFDGNDDIVDIGILAELDHAAEITVMAWIWREDLSNGYSGLVGKYDNSPHSLTQNTFLLYTGESATDNLGTFIVVFEDDSSSWVTGTTAFPAQQWVHVAATWRNSDGSTVLYKNGVAEASNVSGAGKFLKAHRSYTAKIGEWGVVRDWRYKFKGGIDEVAIFNRALSAEEVLSVYTAGAAGLCKDSCPQRGLSLPSVTEVANRQIQVPVSLRAQGNENALSFSLSFDPTQLSYRGWTPAAPSSGISLLVNTNQQDAGRLGFAIAKPYNQHFAAGPNELFKLAFQLSGAPTNAVVSFTNKPVVIDVVDDAATSLCVNTSNGVVTITPLFPPAILTDPQSATVQPIAGIATNLTLNVATTGSPPLQYQWRFGGAPMANETNASLTLSRVNSTLMGNYDVVVSNSGGAVTSRVAVVTVLAEIIPPTIVSPPSSWVASAGEDVLFSAGAAGTEPLAYQWNFNGAPLPGETTSALRLLGVSTDQRGSYSVTVSNLGGSITSANASLAVSAQLRQLLVSDRQVATSSEVDVPVALFALGDENAVGFSLAFDPSRLAYVRASTGSAGPLASLLVNTNDLPSGRVGVAVVRAVNERYAAGTGPVVQMRFKTLNTAGQTPLVFTNRPVALVISDVWANSRPLSTSNGIVEILSTPPAIVAQPESVTNTIFRTAQFSVTATGSLPLSYQWQFNGTNLPGQNQPVLTLANLRPSQAGAYQVIITNPVAGVTSRVATLTVPRLVRVVSTNAPTGNLVDVPVQLLANGDENAVGFSLHFDASRLSFRELVGDSGAAGATVNVNTNSAANGVLGFIAAQNYGSSFNVGTQQLAALRFQLASTPGDVAVRFADSPAARELVDNATSPLFADFQPGSVTAQLVSPELTLQPVAQTVLQGTPVSFSVAATGSQPLSYQWQVNGVDLAGKTGTTLTLPNALLSDAGAYACRISNAAGVTHSATVILTVQPPPADLFVKWLVAPPELVAGEPVTLSWAVTNVGTQTAQAPWQDTIWLADNAQGEGARKLGSFSFYTALAPNQWLTHTGIVIVPPDLKGSHFFGVEVDSAFQIPESNETNNSFFASTPSDVRVADLALHLLASELSSQFGSTIAVSWAVTNVGNASASSGWSDRLYLSPSSTSLAGGITLATDANPRPLEPGTGYNQTVSAKLPVGAGWRSGTWYLVAVADFNGNQTETSKNNNTAFAAIQLTQPPQPDLRVAALVAPASVQPGESFDLVWALTNGGPAKATGLWSDAVVWSNTVASLQLLARFDFTNSLAPGEVAWRTQTVSIPINGPAGSLQWGVQTDILGEVAEENEDNNLTWATRATTVPLLLTLQLPVTEVAEDASNPLITGTVVRNGDPRSALLVALSSSDTQSITVPASINIPAGQSAAAFQARVLRDFVVSAPKAVSLGASAPGFLGATQMLTVLNADLPRLSLTLETNEVWEGSSIKATVSRGITAPDPLSLTIDSSNPGQLSPPAFMTIPAGAMAVSFDVLAVDDNLVEGTIDYTLTVSANGFAAAVADVAVLDNDLPFVTVSLASATVSEGAGPQATMATVTRSIVSARSLAVDLESSNPSAAQVPNRVLISGSNASVTFPVAAVNDDLVNPPKTTVIRPFVLASGTTTRLEEGTGVLLTVTDDDGPTLKVTAASKVVAEGLKPATTITVTRNTDTATALTVTLASSNPSEATVPASATIPVGSASVTVPVVSLTDGVTDGNRSVVLTASANGFVAGNQTITVTDADLPDLTAVNLSAPVTAETDAFISVGYRVMNQGVGPAGTNFLLRVYLAKDAFANDRSLVAQAPFSGTIPVGQYFEQSLQVRTPLIAGDYWLVVEVDAGQEIAEILEDNNLVVSATPIQVRASYGAWVETPLTTALASTPVPMSGRATNQLGAGLASKLVNVHIMVRGTERIISALTDSRGNYALTWQPLPGEAGLYQIFATHPGVSSAPVQDEFRLVGMRANPPSAAFTVVEGATGVGSCTIENLSDVPLTGMTTTLVSAPDGLTVNTSLEGGSTLNGGATASLRYSVSPSNAQAYGPVTIRVSSAEGASTELTLAISVEALRPRLVATPGNLVAGMARGQQTVVEFELVNAGGVATGPITVALPATEWLSLASVNPLPSLLPGDTNKVTFLLQPSTNLTLGNYEGSLALNSANAALAVPFTFRALSEAKGDLLITAVDELTYYAVGTPNLAGANVIVRDVVARTNVAVGITDTNGQFSVSQLPEGYYELEITADRHTTYRQTHLIQAGQTNSISAFLSRQVVTYTWTVEPIEIEDRYSITVQTTFETDVPIPVVTIEPAYLDLQQLSFVGGQAEVEFTIENHGLIAAQDVRLEVPLHPRYQIQPLIRDIGRLPAKSVLRVPVVIRTQVNLWEALPTSEIARLEWTSDAHGRSQAFATFSGVSCALVVETNETATSEHVVQISLANTSLTDLPIPPLILQALPGISVVAIPGPFAPNLADKPMWLQSGRQGNILRPGDLVSATLYVSADPMVSITGLSSLSSIAAAISPSFNEPYYAGHFGEAVWGGVHDRFNEFIGNSVESALLAAARTVSQLTNIGPVGAIGSTELDAIIISRLSVPEISTNTVAATQFADLVSSILATHPVPTIPEAASSNHQVKDFNPCTPSSDDEALATLEAYAREWVDRLLGRWFGHEVWSLWDAYLEGTRQFPPAPHRFGDGDEIVEGYGLAPGFKSSQVTKRVTAELMVEFQYWLIRSFAHGVYSCRNLPAKVCLEDVMPREVIRRYETSLDWNLIWEIPGNIAGGLSGYDIGGVFKNDDRHISGCVTLNPKFSPCGELLAIELESDFKISVQDAVDFCPGGFGSLAEMAITPVLAKLEASGWAESAEFFVEFTAEPVKQSIPGNLLRGCSKECCPVDLSVPYCYPCGPLWICRSASSRILNAESCRNPSDPISRSRPTQSNTEIIPSVNYYSPSISVSCSPTTSPVRSHAPKDGADGVCAKVKLRTEQEAVVTRDAFRATLEIDNQDANRLENVSVQLIVSDADGVDRTSLFGIRPPELVSLSGVDGSGILAGASTGTARWIIIPTSEAAPTNTTQYFVSGRFRYVQNGTELSVPLAPVAITVLPTPRLFVQYFHERDVFSDDPFTDAIEPSVPFNLAVMVRNKGHGLAKNFRVTSAQPQIVENEKGLLIDFKIIATEVAGQNMVPSLTANFGNIDPGQTAIGRWLMTSTLQGLFIDYSATFQHLDALEGVKLSLLEDVSIHEMIHLVQAGGSFEDGKPDFLVNDEPDLHDLPDTLYLSDGRTNPVQVVRMAVHDGPPRPNRLQVQLSASMPAGWAYLRVPEPSDGSYRLVSVRRSDGTVISLDTNVWVTDRTFIGLGRRPIYEHNLHLLDYDSSGVYTLTYETPAAQDMVPPTSQVVALPMESYRAIPVSWTGTDDPSGSGLAGFDIYVSENGGPFTRWLERTTLTSSVYFGKANSAYAFYSLAIDRAGNRETAPGVPDATTVVSLSNRAPVFPPLPDQAMDEGSEFVLQLQATDPDSTDVISYSLLTAPAGMILNPLSGLLHWTTTEANGPNTNQVVVRVQDNGDPPLAVTNRFALIVHEVNQPPLLAPIANYTVNEGLLLTVTNVASDSDLPPNRLAFGLLPPVPAGATINPTNGVFTWRPTETQGPSTNTITVQVADNGVPSLTATQQFRVVVRDSLSDFRLTLGRTNLMAGEPGSVPITLRSSLNLTNLTLLVRAPVESLSQLNMRSLASEVTALSLSTKEAGVSELAFTLNPEAAGASIRDIASLDFVAVPSAHSTIAILDALSLQAQRGDGLKVTNGAATAGRVIIVSREPVLENVLFPERQLLLYGRPGASYTLQYRTNTVGEGPWTEWRRFNLNDRVATFSEPPAPNLGSFWRAQETLAEAPRLTLIPEQPPFVGVRLEGWPGTAYGIQTTPALGQSWQTWTNFTLTNASEVFRWPVNSGETQRFFRGEAR